MKKILLGLVALSAVAIGALDLPATSQVEVTTQVTIDLQEGIVILPTEPGSVGDIAGAGILLNHGTRTTDSTDENLAAGVTESVYIGIAPKRDMNSVTKDTLDNLPEGTILEVQLYATTLTGNDLVLTQGDEEYKIGHTLTATIKENGAKGTISGINYASEVASYEVLTPTIPEVSVNSVLTGEDVRNAQENGLYTNTSYLNVTLRTK